MKLLIQRVTHASVEVENKIVGAIGSGALVFIGVTHGDTAIQAIWLANKLVHLRMFQDAHGKMNLSLLEHKGSVLIVPQFTLYGNCSEGRRPSFTLAAPPELAERLYVTFIEEVRKCGIQVQTGMFGAAMKVSLLNDGPVTFMVERTI